MSKAKFAEPILQTIDQLRSRKARPDLNRICHMVERRHGLSADDVETNLAIMVAENKVLKVNFKGNISYRNPAKWKRRKRDHSETADRKPAAIIRAKLPKKKLLKLKATKALVKPKRKRGRPPLKKKAKVKPVVETDEDTEEEVIDESMMATAVDDDINNDMSKSPEVNSHKQDKSDNESAPDSSADEKSSIGRQKVCIKYQLVKGRKKYELVKGRSSCGKGGSSINRQKTGGTESDLTTCENGLLNDIITDDVKDTETEPASSLVSSKNMKLIMSKKKKMKRNIFQDLQSYLPVKKACHEVSKKDDVKMNSLASEIESQDPKCDYCLSTASSNRNGQPEELLVCKDCQAKAHPSCMDYSDVLARRACQSPWQCIDCKTCNICNGSGDADAMLFCDACDKGYHMNCHQPPIDEKPTGKWVCCQCVVELGGDGDQTSCGENDQEINGDQPLEENLNPADSGGASCLPTPNDSPVHFSEDVDESKMSSKLSPSFVLPIPRLAATLTAEVPDASSWSIVDVVKFFSDMGFTEQSEAFKEQEIDGRALLLMTRMDVLTGLSLKLGPALKIYVHVQRLQAKHLNSH